MLSVKIIRVVIVHVRNIGGHAARQPVKIRGHGVRMTRLRTQAVGENIGGAIGIDVK